MPDNPCVAPLLRWAGSKRALLDQLMARRPPGNWRYVEPFAGSACLFFALRPQPAILGDRNRRLIQTSPGGPGLQRGRRRAGVVEELREEVARLQGTPPPGSIPLGIARLVLPYAAFS
jgi:D12 class N6 adenine-specific DNA methyltransferase